MRTSVRTIYTAQDPDYATIVLGYLSQTPLYANLLNTGITDPIETDTVLLFDPPADINAADFIEASVIASPGETGVTESNNIEETFTFIQTKGFNFAGMVYAWVNATIDMDEAGNLGGVATITDILVELLKYDLELETTTQLAYAVHTVNKSVACATSTDSPYGEATLSEPFIFNIGIDPPVQIGETAGVLLQMRVKISFTAYAPANQTLTRAKCRLNCYRDRSKVTYLQLAVV
jgi:hypothetical protein